MKKLQVNVYAKRVMVDHVVIIVCLDTTTIPIVCRVIVQCWVVFQRFAMLAVNVRVWPVSLESSVLNVVLVIMHIQSVYVSSVHISWFTKNFH